MRILARYLPLVGHVVPTLVIGFGVVIPGSCIAGWNALTVGFGLSVAGTCLAHEMGLRVASRFAKGGHGHASS